MDHKTKGSWLIHHTNKLQSVTNQAGFQNTFVAGKAGILLSAVSSNSELTISNDRLSTLATAANIGYLELPSLINVLKEQELIDVSSKGISVLGVTTAKTLEHTADIFTALKPSSIEIASIALAERASTSPILANDVSEELADTYKLSSADLVQLLKDSENIGFVDTEKLDENNKLLFNGNLFRRDTTAKVKAVLDSLKLDEQNKLIELGDKLKKTACVTVDFAQKMLGETLFQKVISVGLYDVNVVSNSTESVGFITLPSAFSKFSSSMIDDAFDLAKAFVSSITYGMTKSSHERGQISMVTLLLKKLVDGKPVGPVPAIAQDYKVLELKGVVQVSLGYNKGKYGYLLRLLKKEVGELALQVIDQGDVSEHSLTALPSAAVTSFNGPEYNREKSRKKQMILNPKMTNDMLSVLRTGGGL